MTFRQKLEAWVESPLIRNTIVGIIIFNAITLGLETSDTVMMSVGGLLHTLDAIILTIFVAEIAIKLFAKGPRFFLEPWNVFDFVIISIALLPDTGQLSVLRALRIFRVLRVISISPTLQRVVEGFLRAVPGMASVFLLMAIIFYIGAVMATNLYGETFPQWFGSIGASLYSLFQIMTLESWSMGIVRPVMAQHSFAWMFFVPFIMVTTFAVVNLVIGLIVNSMESAHAEEEGVATDTYRHEVLKRLEAIEKRLNEQERP